jgi:tetratricopeptide (TPR) repeat protein/TolB-like protein
VINRQETLDRLFVEALPLSAEARAALLGRECQSDDGLRRDVQSLLTAAANSEEFLTRPALERLARAMAADGWNLRPGERLGPYVVHEMLGAGAVGEVWRATDERLNRDVAIKLLLPHLSDDPERTRRFAEEARTAGSLNHPNILSVHDVGDHGGVPFIVSECVDGESLRQHLTRGPLSVERSLAVALQIARGLAAAHSRGIIHRDLKPDNVFLRKDGGVKILDFGLAKLKTDESGTRSGQAGTTVSTIAGTAGYIGPEQIAGREADVRSDLFALGVTMFEMLSGERPFKGRSTIETLNATLTLEPTDVRAACPAVPPALARIVMQLLAKAPESRCQSADEVVRELERASAAASRRSPVPLRALVAISVIAASAVAAAFLWRDGPDAGTVALGPSGRPAVAVMNFVNMTGTEETAWLSTGVQTMLLTGLAETPGLDIVSTQRVHEALKQAGHADLLSLDRSEAAGIARRAGAGAIVTGTIYKTEKEIRIDVQVEDLVSGRVLAAHTAKGTDVFSLADSLATRIRTGIGFGEGELRRIADVSSTSIAAYSLYAKGLDAIVNARLQEAVKWLEQAIAADPTFAEAHMRLASAYGGLGQNIARDKALRDAATHAAKLSERHRLMLAVQLEGDPRGNPARRAQLLDELLARFPDVEEAYSVASALYDPVAGAFPNLEKLLTITRAGATVLPASPQTRNAYGYTLTVTGRFAEAAREFEEYARLAPREPNPFHSLGDAYVLLGSFDKAVASYSRALTIDPGFPANNGLAYALGILGRYDEAIAAKGSIGHVQALLMARTGRYAEAARIVRSEIARARTHDDMFSVAGLQLTSAVLAFERKDYDAVRRAVAAARQPLSAMPQRFGRLWSFIADTLIALADLSQGRVQQAQAHADAQARTYRQSSPVERLWHEQLKGELALARGDAMGAAKAFAAGELPQRGISLGVPGSVLTNNLIIRDGPARAASARDDIPAAIEIYRRLLANGPDLKWIALYEPRYVLQLARLHQRAGDRASALAEYRRFLELWKHADASLPELAEARKALGNNWRG